MVLFKCKMCGGNLEVSEGSSVATCEYCGTEQTLPTSNDEGIVNLFNRANYLRLKCEFDKASETYKKILDLDNTQAEAHWGIVLCKYGIEYVDAGVDEDLFNSKKPTCHRTQLESILTDPDYLEVLQNADVSSQPIYKAEAKRINEIQKKILEVVKNEKPFDVFICYKERDENNQKTRDSVIANEIYHELTDAGLKVFYAAITLEDKLGEEYEPYIYAALSSAKVMLALGTRLEYFNAVWVKNEWSRYLHMMKTDKSKRRTLIPCYRDMDAYDLPDEFSHLQALDMSGIAFIPDLIRNIRKLTGNVQQSGMNSQQGIANSTENQVLPLLKRAFLFLEDGEFKRADEMLEKVLDLDPENARAYLGKVMLTHRIRTLDDIITIPDPLMNNQYYRKALRFADPELRKNLEEYNNTIVLRLNEKKYSYAIEYMKMGNYIEAAKLFSEISGYKDANELYGECQRLEVEKENQRIEKENQERYNSALALVEEKEYLQAANIFKKLGEYKDSSKWVSECIQYDNEERYSEGMRNFNNQKYVHAQGIFRSLGDFENSKEMVKKCISLEEERVETEKRNHDEYCQRIYADAINFAKHKKYNEAIANFRKIEGYRNADHLLQKALDERNALPEIIKKRKERVKIVIIVAIVIAVIAGIVYLFCTVLSQFAWIPIVLGILIAIGAIAGFIKGLFE